MPRINVQTLFDCQHQSEIEVRVDKDVQVPETVRGLGQCPSCMQEDHLIAIPGVAPQAGGKTILLDSILMMAIES